MLTLISPAKTLDFDSPWPEGCYARSTRPAFAARSAELMAVLRTRTADDLSALMAISPTLATLNAERNQAWSTRFTATNSRPALLAFAGDVYEGLQAASLTPVDWAWAQDHLRMLSGLYGLLRPLDRLQPYRLEMGTRLANPAGPDLYHYWGDDLARAINRLAPGVVLNLASQEYARAALRPALKARVVSCHFEEWHGGQWKLISFHAKRARGLMARHAIRQQATSPEALLDFAAEGYRYDVRTSTPERLVFRRKNLP
ncbi:MAG: peroxide stress protein YaaA [Proteobacteria bacterium]|nr:peroxide stress protein YaaA [Pseudomonadota bacterium]